VPLEAAFPLQLPPLLIVHLPHECGFLTKASFRLHMLALEFLIDTAKRLRNRVQLDEQAFIIGACVKAQVQLIVAVSVKSEEQRKSHASCLRGRNMSIFMAPRKAGT